MSVRKGFSGGFGGCLGVGCAVIAVVVGLPISCLTIAVMAPSVKLAQDAAERTRKQQTSSPASSLQVNNKPSASESQIKVTANNKAFLIGAARYLSVVESGAANVATNHQSVLDSFGTNDLANKLLKFYACNNVMFNEERAAWLSYNQNSIPPGLSLFAAKIARCHSEFSTTLNQMNSAIDDFTNLDDFSSTFVPAWDAFLNAGLLALDCNADLGVPPCAGWDKKYAELHRSETATMIHENHNDQRANDNEKSTEVETDIEANETMWRTWTSSNGRYTLKAKFIKTIGDSIYLENTDGMIVIVPREKLCEEDWTWITNH